ncbi:MAG: helix-turn-helix domain-containing protein [Arcanobacterium sp.]|nr:helix-turn-helix domain-containing protein [Arcanobacterium sp.]
MHLQRSDALANHYAFLTAAKRLLSIHPNATIDELAQEAGLSRRCFYQHFSSRTQLVNELLENAETAISDAVSQDHPDVRIALAELVLLLWGDVESVRASVMLTRTNATPETIGSQLITMRLEEMVVRGVKQGYFRTDLTPQVLVPMLGMIGRSVLRERHRIEAIGTRSLIKMVWSVVGVSCEEQELLLAEHPELCDRNSFLKSAIAE